MALSPDNFGRHLIIDAWCTKTPEVQAVLNDPIKLAEILNTCVELVGMTILEPASIKVVPLEPDKMGSPDDDGGITGTVLLTTSHGAIHTWPLHYQFSFDLYSCRDFDGEIVVRYLVEHLGMCGGEVREMMRNHNGALKDQILWSSTESMRKL